MLLSMEFTLDDMLDGVMICVWIVLLYSHFGQQYHLDELDKLVMYVRFFGVILGCTFELIYVCNVFKFCAVAISSRTGSWVPVTQSTPTRCFIWPRFVLPLASAFVLFSHRFLYLSRAFLALDDFGLPT